MASNPSPVYEFCQYVHKDGRRCINGYAHGGDHNVQPVTSTTVQAIERREKVLDRLGGERPPLSAESLTASIDKAVGATDGGQPGDDDVRRQRAASEAALGSVPQEAAQHDNGLPTEAVEQLKREQAPAGEQVVVSIDPANEDSMVIKTSDGRVITQEQLDKLVAEAERGYDPKDITPTPVVRNQESTVPNNETDPTVIAVEAPQNDATVPLTDAQPDGSELIATQVDDEPAQVAEVTPPTGETPDKA